MEPFSAHGHVGRCLRRPRYEAGNINSTSNSGGVSGDVTYSWTQTRKSDFSASYQRTKLNETDPRFFDETSNPWSANVSTVYTGQLSTYRVSLGRTLTPSGAGGLFQTGKGARAVGSELHAAHSVYGCHPLLSR